MKVFIAGTGTDVGKTVVSSWICLHTGYSYFKPIQTGAIDGTDSQEVFALSGTEILDECYVFDKAASPNKAASDENSVIEMDKIYLPSAENLIVEGAGGLMVPITKDQNMIDLVKKLRLPVILVTTKRRSSLSQTMESINALRFQGIPTLGIIANQRCALDLFDRFEEDILKLTNVETLAVFPHLSEVSKQCLLDTPFSDRLKHILM